MIQVVKYDIYLLNNAPLLILPCVSKVGNREFYRCGSQKQDVANCHFTPNTNHPLIRSRESWTRKSKYVFSLCICSIVFVYFLA